MKDLFIFLGTIGITIIVTLGVLNLIYPKGLTPAQIQFEMAKALCKSGAKEVSFCNGQMEVRK